MTTRTQSADAGTYFELKIRIQGGAREAGILKANVASYDLTTPGGLVYEDRDGICIVPWHRILDVKIKKCEIRPGVSVGPSKVHRYGE